MILLRRACLGQLLLDVPAQFLLNQNTAEPHWGIGPTRASEGPPWIVCLHLPACPTSPARPYGDAVAACGDTSDLQASGAV